jgi:hypothetical protein
VSLTAHHLAQHHPTAAPELFAKTSWQRSHRRRRGSRTTAVAAVVVTTHPRVSPAHRADALGCNGSWARPADCSLGLKYQPITVYEFYNIVSNLNF